MHVPNAPCSCHYVCMSRPDCSACPTQGAEVIVSADVSSVTCDRRCSFLCALQVTHARRIGQVLLLQHAPGNSASGKSKRRGCRCDGGICGRAGQSQERLTGDHRADAACLSVSEKWKLVEQLTKRVRKLARVRNDYLCCDVCAHQSTRLRRSSGCRMVLTVRGLVLTKLDSGRDNTFV